MLKKIKSAISAAASSPITEAELWDRHNKAGFALDTAREKYKEAARLAEIHPGDPALTAALQAAQAEKAAAQQRVDQIAAAIEAQQQVERNRTAAEVAAERARRWDLAQEHAGTRTKAAKDIEEAWIALKDAHARLWQASDDMRVAAPISLEAAGLVIGIHVDSTVRLQGVKAGLRWAASWPWPPEQLPSLSEVVVKANAHLQHLRAKDLAKG